MPAIARMLRTLFTGASSVDVSGWPVPAASGAVSSVVTCRKTSSRLMRIGRSSSSPQPRVTTALAISRRTSMPRSLSTSKPPPVGIAERTRVTPGICASAGARLVRARRIDLHVHRLRARQAGRQVVGRVDRDDPALVDDDDALAGLRDLGQDVRAQDDRVVAGQAADELRASR